MRAGCGGSNGSCPAAFTRWPHAWSTGWPDGWVLRRLVERSEVDACAEHQIIKDGRQPSNAGRQNVEIDRLEQKVEATVEHILDARAEPQGESGLRVAEARKQESDPRPR